MSSTRFRVNPHSIVAWMLRNFLLEAVTISEVKWLQRDSNPHPNTQPFSQTGQTGWAFVYELKWLWVRVSLQSPKFLQWGFQSLNIVWMSQKDVTQRKTQQKIFGL